MNKALGLRFHSLQTVWLFSNTLVSTCGRQQIYYDMLQESVNEKSWDRMGGENETVVRGRKKGMGWGEESNTTSLWGQVGKTTSTGSGLFKNQNPMTLKWSFFFFSEKAQYPMGKLTMLTSEMLSMLSTWTSIPTGTGEPSERKIIIYWECIIIILDIFQNQETPLFNNWRWFILSNIFTHYFPYFLLNHLLYPQI